MKFRVTVVSPRDVLYRGEADEIHVPGEEGGMSILANHAPLLASLKNGEVLIVNGSDTTTLAIEAGFIEVSKKGQSAQEGTTRFVNILVRQP